MSGCDTYVIYVYKNTVNSVIYVNASRDETYLYPQAVYEHMASSLLAEDYRIEKEEKSNSHKIMLVGGVAAIGVIGAVAGLYYARGAKKETTKAVSQIASVSSSVSQLQPEVSQLTQDVPQIESQLSAIQAQQQKDASLLSQLQPLASEIASIHNVLSGIESDVLNLPSDIGNLGKALETDIPQYLAAFGSDLSKLPPFSQLLTAEQDIAKYLPSLYSNLKSDVITIENYLSAIPADVNAIPGDLSTLLEPLKSYFTTFENDLGAFSSLVNSLPSDLQTRITSALGPELSTIEGDVSPIISTLENYVSPISATIGNIKGTVEKLPTQISSLGSSLSSDISSLGSFFGF